MGYGDREAFEPRNLFAGPPGPWGGPSAWRAFGENLHAVLGEPASEKIGLRYMADFSFNEGAQVWAGGGCHVLANELLAWIGDGDRLERWFVSEPEDDARVLKHSLVSYRGKGDRRWYLDWHGASSDPAAILADYGPGARLVPSGLAERLYAESHFAVDDNDVGLVALLKRRVGSWPKAERPFTEPPYGGFGIKNADLVYRFDRGLYGDLLGDS